VVGKRLAQPRRDQRLDGAVGLGHQVDRALVLDPLRLPDGRPEMHRRLGGGVTGNGEEGLEIVHADRRSAGLQARRRPQGGAAST
jgi:hypothetical protein